MECPSALPAHDRWSAGGGGMRREQCGLVRLCGGTDPAGRQTGFLRNGKRGRLSMKRQALFFSVFGTAMLVWSAFAADGVPGMMGLRWGKNAFNFEGMPSGP